MATSVKITGVEPTTRQLNGEDPVAFVLSANIHRRHLTKGQRTMATAIIYPEPREGMAAIPSEVSKQSRKHPCTRPRTPVVGRAR